MKAVICVIALCAAASMVPCMVEGSTFQDPARFMLTPENMEGMDGMVCLCTANYTDPADMTACMSYEDFCADVPDSHYLEAGLHTGHWGIFYSGFRPALIVKSGDTIDLEMVAAGMNAWEEQVMGDPAMEAMFEWGPGGPRMKTKGALGGGEGGHWLTGPIYMCGAEAGDVLQVDVLDLTPRPNPGMDGRSFGWTSGASWGYHYQPNGPHYLEGEQDREIITVWEMVMDDTGHAIYCEPKYNYNFKDAEISTSCSPSEGEFECTYPKTAASWTNADYMYGGVNVPCEDGKQEWDRVVYGGYPISVPEDVKDYGIAGKYRVPGYLHIGNIGLAPDVPATVYSVAPMRTGGNMDQKRITAGATVYFPVEVKGAMLSMGDMHGNQGDGETTGTGIEMSANGKFRVSLHKKDSLPPIVSALDYVLIENANEWVVQGGTYNDFLRELDDPWKEMGSKSDLNRAYTVAYNNTRTFLMTSFNLTEDEVVPLMATVVDFGVTQVVDHNWGIHAIIPKFVFDFSMPAPYIPKTVAYTSVPLEDTEDDVTASSSP